MVRIGDVTVRYARSYGRRARIGGGGRMVRKRIDLVRRLRSAVSAFPGDERLCDHAANEIERLWEYESTAESELVELRAEVFRLSAEREGLVAEVDRLEQRLESIPRSQLVDEIVENLHRSVDYATHLGWMSDMMVSRRELAEIFHHSDAAVLRELSTILGELRDSYERGVAHCRFLPEHVRVRKTAACLLDLLGAVKPLVEESRLRLQVGEPQQGGVNEHGQG